MSSNRNQNPSRYHNSISNIKFQHKPKYHLSVITYYTVSVSSLEITKKTKFKQPKIQQSHWPGKKNFSDLYNSKPYFAQH